MNYVKGMVDSMKNAMGYGDLKAENPNGDDADAGEQSHTEEERKQLWSLLSSYVGADLVSMHVSLPVWLFEPLSVLQKQCESLEFAGLLNTAGEQEDPSWRLAYICTFIVAAYTSSERTGKPFNPILGETFEYVNEKDKWRFIAEQVSHHPPISAGFCEGDHFQLWQETDVKTKFCGNSIEVYMKGATHLNYPKTGDYITWVPATTCVHNIILGKIWIDNYGDIEVKNHTTGAYAKLNMAKCGWFSKDRYQVTGGVYTKDGVQTLEMSGKWNEVFNVTPVGGGSTLPTWFRPKEQTDEKWKFNKFSHSLNEITPELDRVLPENDSRRRTDLRALYAKEMGKAGQEKNRLEEKQRAERKARAAANETWVPRLFKRSADDVKWDYTGNYWEEREKKMAASS
eukprot:GFYU01004010.1.p1 GENE.GFYU01004010.1~~GFYU01004010.1.p1  ORF type:complete len:399 (-),score=124.91 GFYU01004010.1:286-1482(-)